tara:strand:- start:2586 stop:3785 length:1200 start_codon:yes stop_codon:yes gene_type:complete
MSGHIFIEHLKKENNRIKEDGLYKREREIISAQAPDMHIKSGQQVLNLCANNYLGLANHPRLIKAAKLGLEQHGFGMASVRFICGTQSIHKELENSLSNFLGMEDTILYSSCFDANAGLFETLLTEEDAIISDGLNHASIIDGIRLCKAQRYRYANNNMHELEQCLKEAEQQGARFKMIATDGVFSMDGVIANLNTICDLAEQYGALVMVDDSHATGFIGAQGKGTHEFCQVMDRIDILTGTLGKALGGASGGYTSSKKEVVDWLRQRSRPYLFSNSLAPSIVKASIEVIDLLKESDHLRAQLQANASYFRDKMSQAGFSLVGTNHAIIPVMIGDARRAQEFAERLLQKNIYAVAFSYPVVPKNQARIRTQISAAHTREQLDTAIYAFRCIGTEMGIIK